MKIFFSLLVAGVMAGCSKNDGEEGEWWPNLKDNDPVPEKEFDTKFYRYCLEKFDSDGDGILLYSEMKNVSKISIAVGFESDQDLRNMLREMSSLKGIKYFTGLRELYCEDCAGLADIDITNNKALKLVYLRNSPKVTKLDVSKNTGLLNLGVRLENVMSLDVSKNKILQEIDFAGKNLVFGKDNTSLTKIWLSGKGMTAIDISSLPMLEMLSCNDLVSLDVSKNKQLKSLYAPNLQILYVWKGWTKPDGWSYPESTQIIEK